VKVLAAGLAIACLAVARPAAALEHEIGAGVDLGGALLVQRGKSTADLGGAAGVHGTYGLGDAFNLTLDGAWSLVSTSTPRGSNVPATLPSWAANVDLGIVYVLDVIQWVPYAGGFVGGYDFSGGTIHGSRILAGYGLALGLDYRFSPRWLFGVAVRQHMVTDTGTYPSFTQAFARLEYVWGGGF
jgi:hypothetical protein